MVRGLGDNVVALGFDPLWLGDPIVCKVEARLMIRSSGVFSARSVPCVAENPNGLDIRPCD